MHIVYRVTNKSSGRYYHGYHRTDDLHDGYLGSGRLIAKAVAKYGKDQFLKETLFIFDTKEEALEKEDDLIAVSLGDPLSMNLVRGYAAGWNGETHPEAMERLRTLNTGQKNPQFGKKWIHHPVTRESKSVKVEDIEFWLVSGFILGRALKGTNSPKHFGRPSPNTGKPLSEERREKIREFAKTRTGSRNPAFGRVCIHHDSLGRKKVRKEDLDSFLGAGWKLGAGPMPPGHAEKVAASKRGKRVMVCPLTGRRIMCLTVSATASVE